MPQIPTDHETASNRRRRGLAARLSSVALGAAVLAAVGATAIATTAQAQVMERPNAINVPGGAIGPDALAALEALDAPLLSVRESAEQSVLEILLAQGEGGPEQLELVLQSFEEWLASSMQSVGPEGLARAERIASELYRRLPYAGMGMAPSDLPNGSIRIETVVQGFHVAQVLRVGDVVRSLGGERLRGDEHMRTLIVSYRPGDPLDVEFIRAGKTNRGTITLGAFNRLANARPLPGSLVRNAWRERFRRTTGMELAPESDVTGVAGGAIGSDHSPEAWMGATDPNITAPRVDVSGRIRPMLNPRQGAMTKAFVVHTRPGIEHDTSPQRYFRLDARAWRNESSDTPTVFEPVLETELTQLEVLESTFEGQLADMGEQLTAIKEAKGREPDPALLAALRANERGIETRHTATQAELVRLRERIRDLRNRLGLNAAGVDDGPEQP